MNREVTVLENKQRTATNNSADLANNTGKGCIVKIRVTDVHGDTPSITVTIQGKDPLSGQYYTVLQSAAIGNVSTTILRVYPGIAVTANVTASDILPMDWRVLVTHADSKPIDYSISANEIE